MAALLATLPFFLLYLFTCSHNPNLAGDSPELLGGAYTLGIIHPPGYPTYTLIGYLISHVPVGSIAFRMNFFSVILHSLTLFLLFIILMKITRSRTASAITVAALGLSPLFWFYSLVAEVFPLNNLFAVLLLLLSMLVRDSWIEGKKARMQRLLLLLAFLCGLSLTHHHTIVLIFPALLLLIAKPLVESLRKFRALLAMTGSFLLGLLPYAYLPLRALKQPYMNFGDPSTLSSFLETVTRRTYGTTKLWIGPQATHRLDLVFDFIKALDKQVYLMGIAIALFGMYHMARKRKGDFVPLFTAFVLTGVLFPLTANVAARGPFEISTLERFYLLPAILFCPFLAMGWRELLVLLASLAGRLRARETVRNLLAAVLVLLIAMPFYLPLRRNYERVNLRNDIIADRYAQDLLSSVEDGAVLFLSGDIGVELIDFYYRNCLQYRPQVITLIWSFWGSPWYMKHIRKWYPELNLPEENVASGLFAYNVLHYKGRLVENLISNNPQISSFYTMDKRMGLRKEYTYVPSGLCYRIVPPGEQVDHDALFAFLSRYYENLSREVYDYSLYDYNRREFFLIQHISMHIHDASLFFRSLQELEMAAVLNTLAYKMYPFREYEFETAELFEQVGSLTEAEALFNDYATRGSYRDEDTWQSLAKRERIRLQEGEK